MMLSAGEERKEFFSWCPNQGRGILFDELVHILIGKHFGDRHIYEHAQYKVIA